MKKHVLTFIAVVFVMSLGKLFTSSTTTDAKEKAPTTDRFNVYSVQVPADASFAGEKVPLEDFDVYERLDKELLVNTFYQSQTLLLHKRANRWFPLIIPILKRYGIPEDFKYIPMIETGFTNSVSQAGAAGYWQFLDKTAREYDLEVNEYVDERYNVEKATEAACKYFKESYKQFGNWSMVAAAYNMGPTGLKNQVKKQGENSYYDLLLNSETARYVFRLIAVKQIIEYPERYGYRIFKKDLYPPLETYKVKVDTAITNFVSFARQHNINYKLLRIVNPWLRDAHLPNASRKTYFLEIPKNISLYKEVLQEELKGSNQQLLPQEENESVSQAMDEPEFNAANLEAAMAGRGLHKLEHAVAEGEDLDAIAGHYKISGQQLALWNNLNSKELIPNQKLVVYLPQTN